MIFFSSDGFGGATVLSDLEAGPWLLWGSVVFSTGDVGVSCWERSAWTLSFGPICGNFEKIDE